MFASRPNSEAAMRKFCWIALLFFSLTFAGCGNAATAAATAVPAAAPVSTTSSAPGTVSASAVVMPALQSQMSFVISAPVKEVKVKEGDTVQAGQELIVLDAPQLALSVTGADASVKSAEAIEHYWSFPRKNEPPERRWLADAQLAAAQASLETAKNTFAQSILNAPFNGTVVSVNVQPGEIVQPTQVVLVFADLSKLQIETTDLSERDIANVQIGQTATVHIKALNQDFSGKVTAIAPMAVKHNADWVYKVTIELENAPSNLLWGMSADVQIQTGQ
jgi:multidrug resistance efflux pump